MTRTLARKVAAELSNEDILRVSGGYIGHDSYCWSAFHFMTNNGVDCSDDVVYVDDVCP